MEWAPKISGSSRGKGRVVSHGAKTGTGGVSTPTPTVVSTGGLPTIAATAIGPYTSQMVFLDGQVSAAVQLGSAATQTNVLSSYASGSVKSALVSWVIPATGNHVVSAIANPGGSFTPTNPSASAAFVISGTTYTATLPSFDSTKTRVNGAIMRECRYIVIPTNGGTPHAFLSVVFDVRSYAAGGHRVDVQAGTTRDNASSNTVTYDMTVTINGSASYTRSSMEQGVFMRWRHVGYVSLTEGAITHDTSALESMKVVPTYLATIDSETYTFTLNIDGLGNGGKGYDKLRTGIINPNMGDTGGRQDIGLFPRWQALYLKNKTANALECTTRHGDLSGSWSWCITGDSGDPEALIDLDTNPTWRAGLGASPGPLNGYIGSGITGASHNPDTSHHPNSLLLPWLLTGDRYYADQLALTANWHMLHQNPAATLASRNGSEGLLAEEQTRGVAWGLRTLAAAGLWLPDAHPFKAYFATKTQSNLDWLSDRITDTGWNANNLVDIAHPLGFTGNPDSGTFPLCFWQGWDITDSPTETAAQIKTRLSAAGYTNINQMIIYSPWQYTFVALVAVWCHHLGYTVDTAVIDYFARQVRGPFTVSDATITFDHKMMFFPPCAYNTSLGTTVQLPNWGGAVSVHELSELWRGGRNEADLSSGGCPPFTDGGYGTQARIALTIADLRGMESSSYLTALMAYTEVTSGHTMDDYVDGNGEWGLTEAFLTL